MKNVIIGRTSSMRWLESYLGDKTVPIREIHQAAKEQGYSKYTINRAGTELGVVSISIQGSHNSRAWYLPKETEADRISKMWEDSK